MTVGSILVVQDAAGRGGASARHAAAGAEFAARALGAPRARMLRAAQGALAVLPRMARDDDALAADPASGAWLVTTGTWLHDDASIADDRALLERYLVVGARQLARELQGFFVVIAGDRDVRDVTVITDLVGSCRACVRELGDAIAVSTSSLLLAALGDVALDPVGCQEFLGCGIVYEDRTLYADVRKLAPASVHRFRAGTLAASERYWRVADLAPDSLSGPAAVAQFADALVATASHIARRHANPVCDLTGGYDSRGLAAGLLSAGMRFTAAVSGPEDSADVRISRELAALTGLAHIHTAPAGEATLPEMQDALRYTHGEYDVADYARILKTHATLAPRFDVSLNGSFGEVARGYWWELLFPRTGATEPLDCARVAGKRFAPGFDQRLVRQTERLDATAHFTEVAKRTNHGLDGHPNTLQMDHLYLMMRMRCWQGAIASSTNRLWPCLSPFLARPVLETMLQCSASARARSLLMRATIARLQPRLARHPLEYGHPAMPARLSNLHRFAPLGAHFGRKAVAKVARRLGSAPRSDAAAPQPVDTAVQALLASPPRPLERLLDAAAMERWLAAPGNAAPGNAAPSGAAASRLLTVCLALRALQRTQPVDASAAPTAFTIEA